MTIGFAVLGVVVLLFVWNVLPPEIVAVGAALMLYGCSGPSERHIVA